MADGCNRRGLSVLPMSRMPQRLEGQTFGEVECARGLTGGCDLAGREVDADEPALRKRERHRHEVATGAAAKIEDAAARRIRRVEAAQASRGREIVRTRRDVWHRRRTARRRSSRAIRPW